MSFGAGYTFVHNENPGAPGAEGGGTAAIRISLDGSFTENSSLRSAIHIGPAANDLARTSTRAAIQSGSVLTIRVNSEKLSLPRDAFS